LLLTLASTVILGSEIHGTHDHILQTPLEAFRLYISNTSLLTDGLTAKLLLALACTVILGSEIHGIDDHILLSDGSGSLQNSLRLVYNLKFL
jgi:hypothetical protein